MIQGKKDEYTSNDLQNREKFIPLYGNVLGEFKIYYVYLIIIVSFTNDGVDRYRFPHQIREKNTVLFPRAVHVGSMVTTVELTGSTPAIARSGGQARSSIAVAVGRERTFPGIGSPISVVGDTSIGSRGQSCSESTSVLITVLSGCENMLTSATALVASAALTAVG